MKKQLLALAVAVMGVFGASAQQTAVFYADGQSNVPAEATKISGQLYTASKPAVGDKSEAYTNGDVSIQFEKVNSSNSYVTGNLLRWYANDKMTVTPLNGATITGVTITVVGSSYQGKTLKTTLDAPADLMTSSGALYTISDIAEKSAFTITAGAQIRVSTIEIKYESGVVSSIATPEIGEAEYDATTGKYNVTVTCETEDVEFHYTVDGTEPTVESALSDGVIALEAGSTTLKVIAVKDGESSNLASQLFDLAYHMASFAEVTAKLAETNSFKVVVDSPVSFVAYGNNTTYFENGGKFMQAFAYDQQAYAAGDVFASIEATAGFRNGVPQFTLFTLGEKSEGAVVEPTLQANLDNATAENVNAYYRFENATISGVSGSNGTLTLGGATLALYNSLGLDNFANDTEVTVEGFVSLYNSNVQFVPSLIANPGKVEAPVITPNGGKHEEGTLITIECVTEGATIEYSFDGEDWMEYTQPLTLEENMTLYARATMEGLKTSDVVVANFTIIAPVVVDGTEATFNFNDVTERANISLYDNEGNEVEWSSGNTTVSGLDMTLNGVTIVATKGGNNDAAVGFTDNTFRAYTGATITVSMPEKYVLTQIEFTSPSSSYFKISLASGQIGTLSGTTWTAPAAPASAMARVDAEKTSSVVFNVTGTSRIETIKVSFADATVGVESIAVEEAAPALYYNLQGVRVENPAQGLYIRVAGNKAEKVYIR